MPKDALQSSLSPTVGWVRHYREKTSGQNSRFRALAENHLCHVPPSALQIYVMSVTACGNFQTCKICPCPHLHPNCTADVPFCPVAVKCIRVPQMPKDALRHFLGGWDIIGRRPQAKIRAFGLWRRITFVMSPPPPYKFTSCLSLPAAIFRHAKSVHARTSTLTAQQTCLFVQ